MRSPLNRRRTVGVLALVVVTVLAAAWYAMAPGEAPAGQPAVVSLDTATFEALRGDFNRDASQTRLIVLLSPT